MRIIEMVLLPVMLMGGLISAQAPGNRTVEPAAVVSPDMPTAASTHSYWSADRMTAASAKEVPMPVLPPLSPGSSEAVRPHQVPQTTGYSYPYPHTRSRVMFSPVNQYQLFPFKPTAKMYVSFPGIGDFSCSATVIDSGFLNRRALVLTAGRCVNTGGNGTVPGTWATSVRVCPSYRDGVNPHGCWAATRLVTTGTWHWSSNIKRNVAFVVTSRDGLGRSIGDVVDFHRIGFNAPFHSEHWVSGYPTEPPFTGERMMMCAGPVASRLIVFGRPGPDAMAMGCDMNGVIGAAWIREPKAVERGWAGGVTSAKFADMPFAIFGSYFDTVIENVWRFAQGYI